MAERQVEDQSSITEDITMKGKINVGGEIAIEKMFEFLINEN